MESENDTCFDQISSHILRAARNTPNWQIAKGLIIEIRETWAIGTIIDYSTDLRYDLGAISPADSCLREEILTFYNGLLCAIWSYIGAAAAINFSGAELQDNQPSISQNGTDIPLLKLTFTQLQEIVPAECRKQLNILARLDLLQQTVDKTLNKVTQPIPSPHEYAVTPKQLEKILCELHAKRSARTIQLWDKWLRTDGKEGVQPLDDYNLYTRLSLESATTWAKKFAARESSRLRIKISLDRRHCRSGDNEDNDDEE